MVKTVVFMSTTSIILKVLLQRAYTYLLFVDVTEDSSQLLAVLNQGLLVFMQICTDTGPNCLVINDIPTMYI